MSGASLGFSGGYTLSVTGDWTNNGGTFTSGAGTVTFNGSSAQIIGGTSPTTFNNLTIDNMNNINLAQDIVVNGVLTFTAGKLIVGNFQLTLGPNASIVGASASNYFVTNGTDVVKRTVGSTAVLFPVGTSTSYNPVTITNSGTPDEFSVKVQTGFDNAPYGDAYVNRQWTISEATAGGSNAEITLVWNTGDENGSYFVRTNSLTIGHWSGGVWVPVAASYSDLTGGAYSATASGFTSFSPFGVSNVGAMPVELTSFSARMKDGCAILAWTTATELNNFGFEIERSPDRESWMRIGFVPGIGTCSSPKSYEYIDRSVDRALASTLYRLKQVDRDGRFEYSSVVEVANKPGGFRLSQNYPNPFSGPTTITYTLPQSERVTVRVHDLLGTEIATLTNSMQHAGTYALRLDPVRLKLQPGYYICAMHAGRFRDARTVLFIP